MVCTSAARMMLCVVIATSLGRTIAKSTPALDKMISRGGEHGANDIAVPVLSMHLTSSKAADPEVLQSCELVVQNIVRGNSSAPYHTFCNIMVSNEIHDNPIMELSFVREREQFVIDACDKAEASYRNLKAIQPEDKRKEDTKHYCNEIRVRVSAFGDALKHRDHLEHYTCEINATKADKTCSGNGICSRGSCLCDHNHTGVDCSTAVCANDCGLHGFCLNGKCSCFDGFQGETCQKVDCKTDSASGKKCGPHGVCGDVKEASAAGDRECLCANGFTGRVCEQKICRYGRGDTGEFAECSGRGSCSTDGKCTCLSGFTGKACDQCDPVMSHTICLPDEDCYCDAGFWGSCCNRKMCPRDCSGHGACTGAQGECECHAGFTGADCSVVAACPTHKGQACSGVGSCKPATADSKAACVCPTGYGGKACQTAFCPFNNCLSEKHGACVKGKCVCHPGYTGIGCQKQLPMPRKCAQSCHHTCLAVDCRTAAEPEARRALLRAKTVASVDSKRHTRFEVGSELELLEVDSHKTFSCYYDCLIGCTQDNCFEL